MGLKKVITSSIAVLPKPLPQPPMLPISLALQRVTSKTGNGVYASSDVLFRGAIFGRDSLTVGEDLLRLRPKLVRKIILTLARLQGEADRSDNEEELGKIIHEYRTIVVDGKRISGLSKQIYDELASKWGGTGSELVYYGSIDATPHFIRLVGQYCELYGAAILTHPVTLRSGDTLPLRTVCEEAVGWLMNKLAASQSGLLEYQRKNPTGLRNQVWKDSNEFYVHEDGTLANHNGPIASIEVQGLAYDALMYAAQLFDLDPARSLELAERLRDRTIELLWLPDRGYFALGTDTTDDGVLRVIRTKAANQGSLLNSAIFDALPEPQRQVYVAAIVRTVFSGELLTDAGIRSRALSLGYLVKHWDYHGSFVSWPKETYDIAKGLRRQHMPLLAQELENRIMNVVVRSRSYLEFVYVDEWGRVHASPSAERENSELVVIESTNSPERIQAWTVSAVMAITAWSLAKLKQKTVAQEAWQSELERSLLIRIPRVRRLRRTRELSARYPHYPYKVMPYSGERIKA